MNEDVMHCTIGLDERESCIAWREEREAEKLGIYGEGKGEKDENGRIRWEIVQS